MSSISLNSPNIVTIGSINEAILKIVVPKLGIAQKLQMYCLLSKLMCWP